MAWPVQQTTRMNKRSKSNTNSPYFCVSDLRSYSQGRRFYRCLNFSCGHNFAHSGHILTAKYLWMGQTSRSGTSWPGRCAGGRVKPLSAPPDLYWSLSVFCHFNPAPAQGRWRLARNVCSYWVWQGDTWHWWTQRTLLDGPQIYSHICAACQTGTMPSDNGTKGSHCNFLSES